MAKVLFGEPLGVEYIVRCTFCFLILFSHIARADENESKDRVRAFIDSIWAPIPKSYDITLKRKVVLNPRDEKEVRDKARAAYIDIGSKAGWKARPDLIERSVSETMEREGKPIFTLCRYRGLDDMQRVDSVEQSEADWGNDTPFEQTRINGRRRDDGIVESINYVLRNKSATLTADSKRAFWKYEDIWRIYTVGGEVWSIVRGATGVATEEKKISMGAEVPVVIRNNDKANSVINGSGDLVVVFSADKIEEKPADLFEIKLKNRVISRIFTEPKKPSVVFRIEFFLDGILTRVMEMSGHNELGAPFFWKATKYYGPENKPETEEIEVLKACINCPVDRELFEFHPPEGFISGEVYQDKIVSRSLDGRETVSSRSSSPASMSSSPPVLHWRWAIFLFNALFLLFLFMFVLLRKRRSVIQKKGQG